MKARSCLTVRCIERKQKQKIVNIFLKLLLWFNKVIHGQPSIKRNSWKGNATKSRLGVQFVKKIPLELSLANRWKKKGMIKIIDGF